MRLIAIRNGLKQTIFTRSGLEFLQMIPESDIRRCVSENARCHNRTLDGSGLAIVRHSLSNDK